MAALLTVTVVTRARRKKAIIAIRVPMPADPLNPERSSYVNSESPIRTCLNRKPTRFLQKSPGRPAWKIVIYPRRRGSLRVVSLLRRHDLLSSAITPVEVIWALCRRKRNGELSDEDFVATLSRVQGERARWELVELSRTVLSRAEEIVQGIVPMRSLDAIHVASLVTFQAVRNTDSLRY